MGLIPSLIGSVRDNRTQEEARLAQERQIEEKAYQSLLENASTPEERQFAIDRLFTNAYGSDAKAKKSPEYGLAKLLVTLAPTPAPAQAAPGGEKMQLLQTLASVLRGQEERMPVPAGATPPWNPDAAPGIPLRGDGDDDELVADVDVSSLVDQSSPMPTRSQDASLIPPEQRRAALGAETSPIPQRPGALPQRGAQPEALDSLHATLYDSLNKLFELQATPAKDKNGRLKSSLIELGQGALRGLLGGGLLGGLFGAAGGAVRGAVAPSSDEERAQRREVNRLVNVIESGLKIEATLGSIQKAKDAYAELLKKEAQKKLDDLRSNSGGTWRDSPVVRDLMKKAGWSPAEIDTALARLPSAGEAINAQNWKSDGQGNWWYLERDSTGKRVMTPVPKTGEYANMTPAQAADIEFARLRWNAFVADFIRRNGREAAAAADMYLIPDRVPSVITPKPQVVGSDNMLPTGPVTDAVKRSQGGIPERSRSLPDQTRPRFVKPPPVYPAVLQKEPERVYGRRGGFRRGGRGGGGDLAKDTSFNLSAATTAARKAREAAAVGDKETFEANAAEARTRVSRMQRDPNFKRDYKITYPDFDRSGIRLPVVVPKGDRAHGAQTRGPLTLGKARKIAEVTGKSISEIYEEAEARGYPIAH